MSFLMLNTNATLSHTCSIKNFYPSRKSRLMYSAESHTFLFTSKIQLHLRPFFGVSGLQQIRKTSFIKRRRFLTTWPKKAVKNQKLCSNAGYILQVGEAKLKYGILSNAKILFYDACFLGHPHRFVQVRRVRCCITTLMQNVWKKYGKLLPAEPYQTSWPNSWFDRT